jgi:hypothetical protein
MEDPQGGLAVTSASPGRARLSTVTLTAVIAALTVFIVLSAVLSGTFSAVHVWSAAGLIVIIVVTAVVGLVVVRHQPGNPIGWLLAGEAIFMLANIAAGAYAQLVYDQGVHALAFAGLPALILSQLFNVSLTGFPLVILLFPDGRLPSRRWRPVLAAYLAITVVTVVIAAVAVLQVAIGHRVVLQPDGNLASLGSGRTAYAGLIMGVYLLCAGALWLAAVIRQALSWRQLKRTEPDGERRQQLKWLASGAAVCGVLGISAVSTNSSIWEVLILGFAALPLSIGIGILKYRLYEIDRLISRTLAYAIVTGLLVGVYAGLVLLSTHVFTVHGTVAVAASTLAAAALFTPLRRRVQHAVDRRFNRARYDADQTIAAFATHLKDAVDLDSVRTDLTAVVHRALEPAHVSLWLTPRD